MRITTAFHLLQLKEKCQNVLIREYLSLHIKLTMNTLIYSEIPLPSDGFYGFALAMGRQSAIHTENSRFASPTLAIRFYFLSETLI